MLQALKFLKPRIPELLGITKQLGAALAYSLVDALQLIHSPPPGFELHRLTTGEHPAQQRLAAEELIAHNLSLLKMRQKVQAQPAPTLTYSKELISNFLNQLPFKPTVYNSAL